MRAKHPTAYIIAGETIPVRTIALRGLKGLIATALGLLVCGSGVSLAAGGYDYSLVRQFPSNGDPFNPVSAETLCACAFDDNGQVAYVTSEVNAAGNKQTNVHVWDPSGTDKLIYWGVITSNNHGTPSTGVPYCTNAPEPIAITSVGQVSVQVSVPDASGAVSAINGLRFLDNTASAPGPANPASVVVSLQVLTAHGTSTLSSNQLTAGGLRAIFGTGVQGSAWFVGSASATAVGPPVAVNTFLQNLGELNYGSPTVLTV